MIYEFKCGDCEKVSEVWMKMSDPNPTQCPLCGSTKFERIISNTSFALKGSGWYTTDYKKPSSDDKKDMSSATSCGQNASAPCGAGACAKPN